MNSTTGLFAGFNDANAYSANLQTGASAKLNSTLIGPLNGLDDVSLVNSSTAVLPNGVDNNVYSLNLQTGAVTQVAHIAGNPNISAIATRGNTAYTTGFFVPEIYAVNLNTGISSIAATISGAANLYGIALGAGNTAYVVDVGTDIVYQVDLQTGVSSPVVTVNAVPDPNISFIAYKDPTTAYVCGGADNNIYQIHLQTGTYTKITPVPLAPYGVGLGLFGIAILPPVLPPSFFIPTGALNGNNLRFANYLNVNAPAGTFSLFANLSGPQLNEALEAAAPTRNGFLTFASQTGLFALAKTLSTHLMAGRKNWKKTTKPAAIASNELLALSMPKGYSEEDAVECLRGAGAHSPPPLSLKGFNVWGGLLGEYAHGKAQNQTPAFMTKLGGATAAFDCRINDWSEAGFGGAYLFTRLNEMQDSGKANIQQGFAFSYASFLWKGFYLDLAAFGGYYDAHNTRKIALPGASSFFKQAARSSVQGWQLAPHLELGGKRSDPGMYQVEPFLMEDWVANWQSGFTEHGASSLNMKQEENFSSLLRTEIGLRFYETLAIEWGRIVFLEKTSYAFQKMFGTGHVVASLVGSPGSFTVIILTGDQHLGVAEFTVQFFPKSNVCYFDLSYQGEFGVQYQSHQGIVNIAKEF